LTNDPVSLVGVGGESGGMAGTKEKTFPLYLVDASKAEGIVVSFRRIGKGATMACVKMNCTTNHGKTKTLSPVIGMLFILKTATVIFIDPVRDIEFLLDDLFNEWMYGEKLIESCRIKFSLASSIDSMDVTSELMQKSADHLERAAEYKTPSKAPGGFDYNEQEILPALKEFAYSKPITDPEVFADDLQYATGWINLTRVVGELESQSIDGALEIRTMHEAVESELMDNCTTLRLLNLKIDQARSKIGAGPEESSSKWSLPALWGTVSEMASFLDTLVDGEGNSHLAADQEEKVRELVADLVTIQTQSMFERVRTGLVE
jgi:hypothetical protein